MRRPQLQQLAGLLLMLFAASLLPVLLLSLSDHETRSVAWASFAALTAAAGLALWWPERHGIQRLRARDGFIVVALFWVLLSLLSAVPFYVLLDLTLDEALFEAVSGFTTTGATVLSGLDRMPISILYYRNQLQWLGGIGMIVSAVAILPMIGVGGMQLLRAEASGPMKDDKLTPRIGKTAQHLWGIYAGLTGLCALAYLAAGMSPFDAVCHAMSTLSTGGFSTHDASFAYFHSDAIESIAVIFMLLGSVPFTLHYMALHQRSITPYRKHGETIAFLVVVIVAVALTAALVTGYDHLGGFEAWRAAAFAVVTVITSTGYMDEDFTQWPNVLPTFLFYISCIGGCAGSTAGGIKVIRFVVLARNCALQIERLVHPTLVRPLKHDERILPDKVTDAVWGFFALYVLVFALLMTLGMIGGLDQVSAFGATATTLNNLGPGLGTTSLSFATVAPWLKVLYSFAMLLGRLEFFTLLVLLHPAFWRS
ncbi:MAG: potassium transporter [Gammaproteobacteria bacterium]|nr:potassium transporter [Gammaproteobacteria bacterium]MCP5199764.1 potassium transporter [Gammaproteobacteria bacterium]